MSTLPAERLPQAAMISIGHRPELEAFQQEVIVFGHRPDGSRLIKDIEINEPSRLIPKLWSWFRRLHAA